MIDKRLGVLGNLNTAGKKALFLRTYSKDVSVFATEDAAGNAEILQYLDEASIKIRSKPDKIRRPRHGKVVILTESGSCHELDAIYPALGCTVRSDIAAGMSASSSKAGNVVVDDHQRTMVQGLYAAGDVVTDLHQLTVAFGHAAVAATDIHNPLPTNYAE
jgi:thioredoxin reductase (NADPH)